MKKITLILACALLSTGAFAQKGFYYGVKAGLNLSSVSSMKDWYSSTTGSKHQMYADFYAGAFAEYRFGRVIGLQLEAVYSRQGDATKYSGDYFSLPDIKGRVCLKLDYINIPLLIKIYPLEKLSIDLGPQFGFVTKAKETYKEVDTSDSREVYKWGESLPGDRYNSFDLSIAMGVSYQITDMIEVSARYNLGVTDITKGDYFDGKDHMNRVLQIGMGLRF